MTSDRAPGITEAVRIAMAETRRTVSSAEALRDAMLRDPASAAARALAECGSIWRPPPLAEPSGPPGADLGSMFVWSVGLESRAAEVFGPGGVGARTAVDDRTRAVRDVAAVSVIAEELGVEPEAYLDAVEAVLAAAPES